MLKDGKRIGSPVWVVAVLGWSLACAQAHASTNPCPGFFPGGKAPELLNPALIQRAHGVCYRFYSVAESGVSRTTLWSAEHLTRESVARAHDVPREDAFHPEPSIAHDDRAEREDFVGSGWDQGHNTPSGDAPDSDAQYETFSLANISPQDPSNNRVLWEGIEISTRWMARYDGEVYAVTGPAFVGPRGMVGGRVEVPTHIWKAIYDPRHGAAAYITLNRPGDAYAVVSINELTRITGIDPFPALPAGIKANAISLPAPRPNGRKLNTGPVAEQALGLGATTQVSTISGPIIAVAGENKSLLREQIRNHVYLDRAVWRAAHALAHAMSSPN